MDDLTLVLGVGNSLLTDDGAGVHAVRRLRRTPAPNVAYLDGGTLTFSLAEPLARAARLIVIDAARFGAVPGTVEVFEDEAMDAFLGRAGRKSVHEVGLRELLDLSRLSGVLPRRRALIGIQPASLTWGEWPTPAVRDALPIVIERTQELIEKWGLP